ncbi:MAG: TIR domain-containing protein [Chloroflexales bacterium]|nr:TIR domain-containing protein [Chloroflexales bacterium]
MPAEMAQAQIAADEALTAALRALTGREVVAGGTVVSFEGAQTGDVKIDTVAGRDVIKVTVNVYYQPPVSDTAQSPVPSTGAQPTGTGTSCFISYSTADEAFAQQLADRLRQAGVNVWFAPDDVRGGARLYDQIQQAQ